MTIAIYQTLTGITVSSADEARVTANITKTQSILELLLGFTLTPASVETNQYVELGKTELECPCSSIDVDNLTAPDAVQGAYRLYSYNSLDKYLLIDPCSSVYAVKLVRDNITVKTFEELDEYRAHEKFNIVKHIEMCVGCFTCGSTCTDCVQLAVDAEWLWQSEGAIPSDLNQVWVEMITYYSDMNRDLKSQTLGTHRWDKGIMTPPEERKSNLKIIQKYAGGNGTLRRNII